MSAGNLAADKHLTVDICRIGGLYLENNKSVIEKYLIALGKVFANALIGNSDASVIWGVAFDPELEDEMRITIIAADFQPEEEAPVIEEAPAVEEPAPKKAEEDDFFAGMF